MSLNVLRGNLDQLLGQLKEVDKIELDDLPIEEASKLAKEALRLCDEIDKVATRIERTAAVSEKDLPNIVKFWANYMAIVRDMTANRRKIANKELSIIILRIAEENLDKEIKAHEENARKAVEARRDVIEQAAEEFGIPVEELEELVGEYLTGGGDSDVD